MLAGVSTFGLTLIRTGTISLRVRGGSEQQPTASAIGGGSGCRPEITSHCLARRRDLPAHRAEAARASTDADVDRQRARGKEPVAASAKAGNYETEK